MFSIYQINKYKTLWEINDSMVSASDEKEAFSMLEQFIKAESERKKLDIGYFRLEDNGSIIYTGFDSNKKGIIYLPGRDFETLKNFSFE